MVKIYLEEKIGNPELFTGRKKDLDYLLTWVSHIPQKSSKSTALLSRRKTGKSALMQRLYNILFDLKGPVIPFYFEIREYHQWLGHFAARFFKTFVFQYLAFKTDKGAYIELGERGQLNQALEIASAAGLTVVQEYIEQAQILIEQEEAPPLWDLVQDAPRLIAGHYDESIVQMIDEFQFINRFIYRDKACTNRMSELAGSYLHTAEYRNAPLLASGSWVGWLMSDLMKMLPGRFITRDLEPLPEDEAGEMVYRYSLLEDIPITAETAALIAQVTEGSPFYISALMRSQNPSKDLTTSEGVLDTLAFETLDRHAEIRATWLAYIENVLPRVNDQHAKDIVLHLSKHRHRSLSRQKLKQELNLDISDLALKNKLDALLGSDIIERDSSKYQGVQDNIFDKVFRSEYGDDIDDFVPRGLRQEYKSLLADLQKRYNTLLGKHNRYKGLFAEFMIIQHLKLNAGQNNDLYQNMFENLPADFSFVPYQSVLGYHSPPLHPHAFQIDVFARAKAGDYSLIGEVKYREDQFTLSEAQNFVGKAQSLLQLEPVSPYVLFVFSAGGVRADALDYFRAEGMAWSTDERWLVNGI